MEEAIKIWTDEELVEELIERRNVINTRIERLQLLQKRVELIEVECKKRGFELPSDESAALPLHGVMHWVAIEKGLPKNDNQVLVMLDNGRFTNIYEIKYPNWLDKAKSAVGAFKN